MGSSPSQVEIPPGHRVVRTTSSAPSRSKGGFKEVELKPANGSTPKKHRDSPSTSSGSGSKKLQDKVEHVTAGSDADFHTVVGKSKTQAQSSGEEMQQPEYNDTIGRAQSTTSMAEFEQPTYKENEDLVLETFYHQNGAVYSCVFQNGQRFYLDSWQTKDWQKFPKKWYKQGILQTDSIIKNDGSAAEQQATAPNAYGAAATVDDREGFIEHPDKGRIPTYLVEEKRNVHYYYDQNTGGWVKMPLSWELRHDLVKKLMAPIGEALPDWKDTHDMLASLRSSNYDPHDCIATYLAVGDTGNITSPKSQGDMKILEEKDQKIKEMELELKQMKKELDRSKRTRADLKAEKKAADAQIQELRDQLSTLEVSTRAAMAQMESIQRERPKTARTRTVTPELTAAEGEQNVDPETVKALSYSAKQLHKEFLKLKMESKEKYEEVKALMKQLALGIMKIKMADTGVGKELEEIKELYKKEALQRKLLYNKLQELRGNIRVFCRARRDDRVDCCLDFPSDREIMATGMPKKMKFDKVFTPDATQEEVFADTLPIITSCVDGYNVCILAYGQTGSGKTHTMMGPPQDPGVNIRSIKELIKICGERDNVDYTLKASMVEIYNETVRDLLTNSVTVLDIRSQGNKILLPGLTEMFVESLEDIEHIMELGDKNRAVASTKMNSTSSRSHLIFMVTVEGCDKASGAVSTGMLTLCDLAGSERVGKTEATGQRLVEASAINKSLTSLGQVFTSLRTGQLHIPYRNSKLTHILQPCLGGDAKAALFVAVSPDQSNLTETISTLQFGSNARQVQLGQAKKNVARKPPSNQDAWGVEEL